MHIATITSPNYWSHTRALAESLRRHNPAARVHALVIDFSGAPLPPPPEANIVSHALADLRLSRPDRLPVGHTLLELACAFKAPFAAYLLKMCGLEEVIYLDSDIMVCHSLQVIHERLQGCDILLTPHYLHPDESGGVPREIAIIRGGAFNLGFIGLRKCANVFRFLDWWGFRALEYGTEDPDRGIYTDQRWVDMVPGMFDNVRIERHPGCNVAPWNLRGRPLEHDGQRYTVCGQSLVFFHFSKFAPLSDLAAFLEDPPATPAMRSLIDDYRRLLLEKGYALTPSAAAPPDLLPNGEKVPLVLRGLIRSLDGQADELFRGPAVPSTAEVIRRLVVSKTTASLVHVHTYHLHLQNQAGSAATLVERYRRSRYYRLWVDAWFYLFGPQTLKIPVEWVDPNPTVRWLRRLCGSVLRFAGRRVRASGR